MLTVKADTCPSDTGCPSDGLNEHVDPGSPMHAPIGTRDDSNAFASE